MKKLLNKKGFTLMEMLIVVAIIVILVAISIPTFSGSLDKANSATDKANLRGAKSLITAQQLEPAGVAGVEGKYYTEDGTFDVKSNAAKGKCSNHSEAYIKCISGEATWVDGSDNPLEDAKQDCAN